MAGKTLNLDNNSGTVQTKKILATEDKKISWKVGTSKSNSVVKGIESLPSTTPNEKTLEEDKAFTLELIDLVKESSTENINYLKNNFTFSVEPTAKIGQTTIISNDIDTFNLKLSNTNNLKEKVYSSINRKAIHSEKVNDTKELKFVNSNLSSINISGGDKIEILYSISYQGIRNPVTEDETNILEDASKNLAYNEEIGDINKNNVLGAFTKKGTFVFNNVSTSSITVNYSFTPNLEPIKFSKSTGKEISGKVCTISTTAKDSIITLPDFWFKNIKENSAANNNNAIKCWFSNEANKKRIISKTEKNNYIPAVLIKDEGDKGILINLEGYTAKDFTISTSESGDIKNPYANISIPAYSISEFPNIPFTELANSKDEVAKDLTAETFGGNSPITIPLSNLLGTDPIDEIIYPSVEGYKIILKNA